MDSLRERGAPSGKIFVSIVLDARHQLTAVDNKTRENIYCSSNYNCVYLNFRPSLSSMSVYVYRLSNYRVHDTKLVECFQSDGPRASSMSCTCRTSGRFVRQYYGTTVGTSTYQVVASWVLPGINKHIIHIIRTR